MPFPRNRSASIVGIASLVLAALSILLSGCLPEVIDQQLPQCAACALKTLYAAVSISGGVELHAFSIQPDTGVLTSLPSATMPLAGVTPAQGVDLVMDPAKRILYVHELTATSQLLGFHVGANQSLTQVGGIPLGLAPRDTQVDATGDHVYVADVQSPTSRGVWQVDVDANGGMTLEPSSPYHPSTDCCSFVIHPTLPYAFGVNVATTIFAFPVDPSTGLIALTGTNGTAAATSTTVSMDPLGEFVFAMGNGAVASTLMQFTAGGTPPLTALTPTITPTGCTSMSFAKFDPLGRFLYMICSSAASQGLVAVIDRTAMPPQIGTVTNLSALAGAGNFEKSAIAMTGNGKFLYHAAPSATVIDAYQINPVDGTLTLVPGSPFPLDAGVTALGNVATF